MRRLIDLTGRKFRYLEVLRIYDRVERGIRWLCKCECGNEVPVRGDHLREGRVISCGCYKLTFLGKLSKTHGMTKSTTYTAWARMLNRCRNRNSPDYKRYGGIGITVCARWESFENFLEDMDEKPYKDATIERINNEKGYSPDNCRWGTKKKQARNRRNNIFIEFRGESKCISEWAEEYKIAKTTLWARLKRGWSVKRALETPIR